MQWRIKSSRASFYIEVLVRKYQRIYKITSSAVMKMVCSTSVHESRVLHFYRARDTIVCLILPPRVKRCIALAQLSALLFLLSSRTVARLFRLLLSTVLYQDFDAKIRKVRAIVLEKTVLHWVLLIWYILLFVIAQLLEFSANSMYICFFGMFLLRSRHWVG